MIRWKLVKETANRLLTEANITSAPIDIESIIKKQGVKLGCAPAEDHINGFILRRVGSATVIGFNSNLKEVRQRFIMAHELGHLVLHSQSGLHVDRSNIREHGANTEKQAYEEEIEANRFAAEILMPEDFIRADLQGVRTLSADDDTKITELAAKYNVSRQAMTIRLTHLDLILM